MLPGGFDKSSGPGGTPRPSIGYRPPSHSSSSWFNSSSQGHQTPAILPSHNHGVQDLKRTRSPPSFSTTPKQILQNSTIVGRPSVSPRGLAGSNVWIPPYTDVDKPATNPSELPVPKRTRSPFSSDTRSRGNNTIHDDDAQRSSVFPPRLSTRASSHVSYADLDKPATDPGELSVLKQTRSPYSTDLGLRGNNFVHDDATKRPYASPPSVSAKSRTQSYADLDRPATNPREVSVPKRIRSPSSTDLGLWGNNSAHDDDAKRPSVSPPRLNTRSSSPVSYADLDKPPSELPLPKRTRLPFSTDLGLRGNNLVHDDDVEREVQAKAKRLARFRDELSQPEPTDTVDRIQKPQQANFLGTTRHIRSSNLEADGEDQDSSTVIIGYCPDMCPEQERAERERKGDLDQYERLDGDRNHTTESLAVKKYTRTAEREAALIRPMKILQMTMDYLLNLLDQPYDDRFLGLYNFLWDRMRAIRMDLRMQHIFNLGAITMLEQMIRLHIIAMHELCEYTKGEGFSEGFDAHLNIEQMNKTSVELFQLYDDHRKNGIDVPTEREFRGYYALLKLDKHPGYKVEASELSLDLAKMTSGIRQAAEVLFARDVARACRSGNFIAFFRLVRKASYLQACLMHAHFGKLRTQALAALHSGLQNNQGIPVAQVAKWLGMEEENMEDLLDYHGFSIKDFEEPYMVKEGQFLNGEGEYSLKCSKLVHLKRSTTIVEDVLLPPPSCLRESLSPKELMADDMQQESPAVHKVQAQKFSSAIDSHMADDGALKIGTRLQPVLCAPLVVDGSRKLEVASPSPRDIFKTSSSVKSPTFDSTTSFLKPSYDRRFSNSLVNHGQSNIPAKNVFVEALPGGQPVEPDPMDFISPEPENVIQQVGAEIETDTSVDEQVAEAKLKLILRLWRRRVFIKKDLREKKQLAANAALSSLSLGPPMRHHKEQLKFDGDFDIDRVTCERFKKQEQLWSKINVSNVVAPTLGERYQFPKCICWKLLFSSVDLEQPETKVSNLDPASWLRSKLMPENINDDDLVASFPGLSIWNKWDYGKPSTCYLSVVRDIKSNDLLEDKVSGASAVMFLVSENIPWEAQKSWLHKLISVIPYPSRLPLVVLNGTCEVSPSTIVAKLGLNEVVKSKICSFSVVPIVESKQKDGFFSDENLRKALEWLASESLVPPIVHSVKTRELVMRHLHFEDKTSPEQCISAVNHAFDESVKEICDAAKSNPASWPCPEISLVDLRLLESYLPSVGWSSASRIEALIQALEKCKLPYGISWSSLTGIDIDNQKTQLDHLLVRYLMPLMGLPLARKEASALIQTCVGIGLHGSTYHLVPKWVAIFRRIFNWQLTGLSNGRFAMAYILGGKHSGSRQWFEDESCNLIVPSLDEMMQVMRRPSLELELELELGHKEDEGVCDDEVEMVGDGDDVVAEEEEEEDERKVKESSLSRLLEQCKIVQDMIDKKLSLYF